MSVKGENSHDPQNQIVAGKAVPPGVEPGLEV